MSVRDAHALPIAAVVLTGGSSGIGKSFISHMAKLDPQMLICNLSRRKPECFSVELKLRHIETDLSSIRSRRAGVKRVLEIFSEEAPKGRVLLINNAGLGAFGSFEEQEIDAQLRLIEVNVAAILDLTASLMPVLSEREGTIMNAASIVAFQPTPYMSTYGATKAFVLQWTYGLRRELRDTGVNVMAVCPGSTFSEFHDHAGMSRGGLAEKMTQTADQVVTEAMAALRRGQGHMVTGWFNKVQCAIAARLPLSWSIWLSGRVLARYRPLSGRSDV
ncbi:MAG: SDR family NAD(P)-dependent oxidoreductase [Candidatus Synoicihabitans palmerolidicus]|nr:SDR family NAD(P)-dependent oxidoreductase [Candidatus Synoicihabitans palmerolidicus]